VYARRLSQAAKRNALQRRRGIDPLSGTSCRSVDNYHMSLPQVELDNINQPDLGDSSLRASLDRHRLLGIEPVVDPISSMLCQLSCASRKARAVRRQCRISVARRGSRRRSDLLWVGARAIVLARHLLDSVVRNSEIRRDRLISRCQQKYQQIGRLELTFYQCFQRGSKIFQKYGIEPMD